MNKGCSKISALININKTPSQKIEIHQIRYLNNILEQDHEFIKKSAKLSLSFKSFYLARANIDVIENIKMIQKK